MAGPADIFREIHRLRRFAKDLQDQLERTPRLITGQKAKLTRQEDAYKEEVEAIKKLKVGIHEKEVLLKSTHTQINKYETQLNTVSTNKEFEALKQEIKHAREKCAQFEEQILIHMTEVDERTAKLPEHEQALKKAREEFARYEKSQTERSAEQKIQLDETLAKLKNADAQIPEEFRQAYQRVINAMGPDAMAAVDGRICKACNTEITHQNYNDLRAGSFFQCKSCARILYLPEPTSSAP